MSRSELLALFPIVVLPLALLARDLSRRKRDPARGDRVRRRGVHGRALDRLQPDPVRGDDHHEQRHGSRALRRQLRRGLVRLAHRLLRELLPGTVATGQRRRVAARHRAEEAGDRVHEGPPQPAAPGGRGTGRPVVGVLQARADHRARLVDRRSGPRPRPGSACSCTTRCCRSRWSGWSGCGAGGSPSYPLLAIALVATIAAAGTFGVTRYRAPAEVPLVVAAAVGMAAVVATLAQP